MSGCWWWILTAFLSNNQAGCERKTWKFDNDVANPKNWVGGAATSDCSGVVFPDVLETIGTVRKLVTSGLVLPINGELEIQEGGYIEYSSDVNKCIRLTELGGRRWFNVSNWKSSNNAARPDIERVPCVYDDVIFPDGDVAVQYPEVSVSVRSIQIRDVRLTEGQWESFLVSDYGSDQFQGELGAGEVRIGGVDCVDDWCTCHNRQEDAVNWICDGVPQKHVECLEPIRPVGFCGDICGAVVYMNVSAKFSMEALQKRLSTQVNTFASRVRVGTQPLVQITFVEQNGYTGSSVEAARNFYRNDLKNLRGVFNATIKTSGVSLPHGSVSTTALTIVFGTFAAVTLVFIYMYVVYQGPLRNYELETWTQLLPKDRTQFFFNKLDSTQSTSMVSLAKSFDNPLYSVATPTPSTSTQHDTHQIEDQRETDED